MRSALDLLRRNVEEAPQCHRYFRDQGVDLDRWLDDDVPPYIYPLKPQAEMSRTVCGWSQAGEPFHYLFLNEGCVEAVQEPRDRCRLASLILHEMGHLARRDVSDHEPPEFFQACRIGCINPGEFH